MTSPASSEASEIRRRGRQRLIGAIALVIVLVVFVPMVLDSEPRPPRSQPAIPSRDNAPALPAPSPAVARTAPAAPATPKVDPAPPRTEPVPAKVEATPARAEPTAKPAADAKAPPAAPKLAGFAVQVGAFRDEAKLKQARDKLAAAGVPHYTERLEATGGALTRLRAGPFPTREAAEGAQASLKRAALDGKVVPLP